MIDTTVCSIVGQNRIDSGTHASGGIGRSSSITGNTSSRKRARVPSRSPSGIPSSCAARKPSSTRRKLASHDCQYVALVAYFDQKTPSDSSGPGIVAIGGFTQSEPGKGTVFDIYLPKLDGGAKPEREESGPIPVGTGRILFVDDEVELVKVWPRMLQQLGYDVLAKTSSLEALDAFRAQPEAFDLVLTDFTMPDMPGDQLAGEVIKIRADVPIVLCTGFSDKINQARAKELGIAELVAKPLDLRTLAEVIQRALGKEKR